MSKNTKFNYTEKYVYLVVKIEKPRYYVGYVISSHLSNISTEPFGLKIEFVAIFMIYGILRNNAILINLQLGWDIRYLPKYMYNIHTSFQLFI